MTNMELIIALRDFDPEDETEALLFLSALTEAAGNAVNGYQGGDVYGYLMCIVYDLLAPKDKSPLHERLMSIVIENNGVTIETAAKALGVSEWTARKTLDQLRAKGKIRVNRKGRGAQWVITERNAA